MSSIAAVGALVLSVMEHGPLLLQKLADIGQQTGELTPEQADQMRAGQRVTVATDPAWEPEGGRPQSPALPEDTAGIAAMEGEGAPPSPPPGAAQPHPPVQLTDPAGGLPTGDGTHTDPSA